jgi:hypothetical protein
MSSPLVCERCGRSDNVGQPVVHGDLGIYYCRFCKYLHKPPGLQGIQITPKGSTIVPTPTGPTIVPPVATDEDPFPFIVLALSRPYFTSVETAPVAQPLSILEAGADPAASGSNAVSTPKRLKRGQAAFKIRAALESLAEEGKWNVAEADIIARSGVPKSTYYRIVTTSTAAGI